MAGELYLSSNRLPEPLGLHGAQQGDFACENIVLEPLGPDPGKPLGDQR